MASASHRRGRAQAADVRSPPLVAEASTSARLALGSSPTLTAQEQAALAIARRWKESSASNGLNSVAGPDGTVRFLFGASQPSVVCAVFQVCDIELQRGETVNAVHLGDTARWVVEPAVSGSGATEVMHLVIKPMDVDLETTLMVATNRRTYHLRLRSHRSEFIPRIAFIYPEEAAAKWDAITKREATEKADATIPSTDESMNDLSFDYRVEGSAKWKPVRVYNNGQKTFIQMPTSMAASEAPTLLLVRKDGGIWTDEETAMVNYRVQNDRFVVDALFEKAILIAGAGASQDRITITRGKQQ
ncbi:P-type conjugative transfer protein TrbG [Variovorax sp. SRS16]|uniref:P-type conjugative transfer protein TrbG n=1 Tax=Variovorax sp. SRS16 TaxID=282217 RepID=UPI0013A5AC64